MAHAALRYSLAALAWVVARLSSRGRSRLGDALGFFAGTVLRIRRGLVEVAMERAGIPAARATAASMYRELGRGLVELLWLSAAREAEREAAVADVRIDEAAIAALDAAHARGERVVLFASHTGNWELAAAAAAKLLAVRGKKLFVVAKAMRARGVDAFLVALRARLGVEVVAPVGALGAARAALAAGDVVVLPIDQVPDHAGRGLSAPFLGETALVDRAPATLAWRAGATALVVAAERAADGHHHVRHLETVAPPLEGENARVWIDATSLRSTAALERFVHDRPSAWLWLHRRWRAPRAIRSVPTLVAAGGPG